MYAFFFMSGTCLKMNIGYAPWKKNRHMHMGCIARLRAYHIFTTSVVIVITIFYFLSSLRHTPFLIYVSLFFLRGAVWLLSMGDFFASRKLVDKQSKIWKETTKKTELSGQTL